MSQEYSPALRHAVLRFYRNELRARYELGNVRQFSQFAPVSDDQIVALRDFFMEQIYPVPEEREKLDLAFDRLNVMLRSPKRMQPLMGAALTSLWRMGHRLPSAISAGKATIDAYVKTRLLEGEMMAEAVRVGLKEKDFGKRDRMVLLIKAVPEKQVYQLIQDILSLFHALSNVEMLKVAVAFMQQCLDVIEKRGDIYTDEDKEGIVLGLNLLQQGLQLFSEVEKAHFPQIFDGIHQVELDWYRRILSEAADLG